MMEIAHAVLLAAGHGLRMRPLTDNTPKPLLKLGHRTLLDHALDRLAEAGLREVAVSADWQTGRIVAQRPE